MNLRPVPSENGKLMERSISIFRRRAQNCVEKILLTAQTLLYHTYTITNFQDRRGVEYSWQRRKQQRSQPRRRPRSRSRKRSSRRIVRRRRPDRLLTIPTSSIFLIATPPHPSRCPNEPSSAMRPRDLPQTEFTTTDENSHSLTGRPTRWNRQRCPYATGFTGKSATWDEEFRIRMTKRPSG